MGNITNPEELKNEADRAYEQKDYTSAAQTFLAAAEGYLQTQDQLSAAEMKNNASVAYLMGDQPQLALESALETDQVFIAAGDVKRQAIAVVNQAAAYEALGQLEQAMEGYQAAADLLKEIDDQDLRPSVMQALSAIQLRLGQKMDALVSMQAGLEAVEKPSLKQKLVKKILQSPFSYFNRLN
jgi:tetratricopeptide (TPR) repeat protein